MRMRVPDPWGGLLASVAAVVYALAGWQGVLSRDLGLFVYGGQRFLAGEPPYTGVFNRVGPLADMLPGVGIGVGRLVGIEDVPAARAFYLVLSAACVWLLYLLARDTLGSRPAAILSCTAFLCFRAFTELAGSGPRDKTAMLVLLLGALLVARASRWWAFGCLTALATLTWQPTLFPLAVAGLAGILRGRETVPPLRAGVQVGASGLATTLAFAAYFWFESGLSRAVDGFLIVNLTDTSQPSPIKTPEYVWQFLTSGYGPSLYLVLGGLVAGLAGLVPRVARALDLEGGYVVPGLCAAAAVAWSMFALNGPPDVFVVLPFAAMGVGILGLAALRPFRTSSMVPWAVVALALLVAAGIQAVGLRDDTLAQQRASVAAVLRAAPSDATMLSVQAPQALAIAGRRNPSPFQMFSLGFDDYVEDEWPGGLEGYAAWISTTKPELLAVGDGFHAPWLDAVLREGYRRVGTAPKWFWFASTDLPPDRLKGLRSALSDVREQP